MVLSLLVFGSLLHRLVIVVVAASDPGISTCPCVKEYTAAAKSTYLKPGGCFEYSYTENGVDKTHCFAEGYGLNECKDWDNTHPDCTGGTPKSWCTDKWCYVHKECRDDGTWEVEKEGGLPSAMFPKSGHTYSYQTCGNSSYFARYSKVDKMTAGEIATETQNQAKEIRARYEMAAKQSFDLHASDQKGADCKFTNTCTCKSCKVDSGSNWKMLARDLRDVGVTWNTNNDEYRSETKCLGRQVAAAYQGVAQNSYNDDTRVAYMYFGVQENGAMVQWPAIKSCPNNFDARFRPWYASAATGPKDLILVLDNSGSMVGSRWTATVAAFKRVLQTVNEYDYITAVLFNSVSYGYIDYDDNKEILRPATAELKQKITEWIESDNNSPMGGTNFDAGFQKAFELSGKSQSSGDTTRCHTAILFMTDGEDASDFKVDNIKKYQKKAGDKKPIIFTYTFGNDAPQALPKSIACNNEGVHYHVPDGGDIGDIMSRYYTYFSAGTVNKNPRFVSYMDFFTGAKLTAACVPAYYEAPDSDPLLLGVGCVDVNLQISISKLEAKSSYHQFDKKMKDASSKCAPLNLTKEQLRKIREDAGSCCENCSSGGKMWGWLGPVLGVVGLIVGFLVRRMWCPKKPPGNSRSTIEQRPNEQQVRPAEAPIQQQQPASPQPININIVQQTPQSPQPQPIYAEQPVYAQAQPQPVYAQPQPVYAQAQPVYAQPQQQPAYAPQYGGDPQQAMAHYQPTAPPQYGQQQMIYGQPTQQPPQY